ncbi:MAG TPA: hypothetical protein ENI04_01240 [Candidatus Wildermuthbacteria bacterium]|nr:hypothetical protein [Candidatus Wildermuthbacteria bacterium]
MKTDKEIIEEFEQSYLCEYRWKKDRANHLSAGDFLLKALTSQREEFRKKDKEDLTFLKEMYDCSQKLLSDGYDIVTLDHLNKMIEDWKEELEEFK